MAIPLPPRPRPVYTAAVNRNPAENPDLPVEHLKIGECVFTTRAVLLSTVLGSCVAASFFHQPSRAAALFHAMLPDSTQGRRMARPCHYVNRAVEEIMRRFLRFGAKPREIQIRLCGGANTMQGEERKELKDVLDVGRKNVEAARKALRQAGLSILAEDVLGQRGRSVLFDTGTGRLWLRDVDTLPAGDYRPLD